MLGKLYPQPSDDWLRICELLIAAGALEDRVKALKEMSKGFKGPVSEYEVLRRTFGKHEADRLLALRPLGLDGKHGVINRLIRLFGR